jgi:hypothetical protein
MKVLKAQETVQPKGHDKVKYDAVEPTCTDGGLTEGTWCNRCRKFLIPQRPIEPLGHSFSGYKCTVCHAKDSSYKEIRSYIDLLNIANDMGGKYVMVNDITFAALGNWNPIGNADNPFYGVFDGNGYSISYMKSGGKSGGGIFYCNVGTICNLTLENVSYTSDYQEDDENPNNVRGNISFVFGGIVQENRGEIVNCRVAGSVDFSMTRVVKKFLKPSQAGGEPVYSCNYVMGGIAGVNYGNIRECHVTASLNVSTHEFLQYYMAFSMGSISPAGIARMKINASIGAIAGENNGLISSCSTTGKATFSSSSEAKSMKNMLGATKGLEIIKTVNFGSIAGVNNNTVENCSVRSCKINKWEKSSEATRQTITIHNGAEYFGAVGVNKGNIKTIKFLGD